MRRHKNLIVIRIQYHGRLRAVAGKGEDIVEIKRSATVEDLLTKLATRYGERFQKEVFTRNNLVREDVQLLINGKTWKKHKEALGHMLTRDAIIALLPVASGG
jgi:MoaD family protein